MPQRWIRGQGYATTPAPAERTLMPTGLPASATSGGMGDLSGIPGSSFGDYSGAGYDALQHQLGVSGSNPLRPILRQAGVGLGSRLLAQTAFGNEMEPGREAAIRRGIASNQPGREPSLIAKYARLLKAMNLGQDKEGDVARRQAGYTEGLPENALNDTNSAVNAYARYLYSPEYQGQQDQALMGLYAMAQDPSLLGLLTNSSLGIQQSNVMKSPGNDWLGGLLGTAADFAGMGVFDNLFKKPPSSAMVGGGYMGGGYM